MSRLFSSSREVGFNPARPPGAVIEKRLFDRIKDHTFASPEKLGNLRRLAWLCQSGGMEGDFVECGAYRGGSAAVLGSVLDASRRLWLYDSFEGMPATTSRDGDDAAQYVGKGIASENDVRTALEQIGFDQARAVIRKGWFEESFQKPLPSRVALLHCDADWYESVLLTLETFYPLVSEGGVVVMDDFGYWEGCREAFYEFCFRHKLRPLLERFGKDQAWWIKNRTHNRNQG